MVRYLIMVIIVVQNVFKRVEQKYLLTKEQYFKLQDIMEEYFEKDKFYKTTIYNIYFDNDNNDLIINSIEKPMYKEKIRLRSYGEPSINSVVFFEMKQKYKGIVYKRRINLTLKQYLKYMKRNIFPSGDVQIMKEIDYCIKYYKLRPYIFVGYDRLSYYLKEDKNFRVTFDSNLRSRTSDLKLKDTKDNSLYFDDNMYIMEVKSLYGLPLWFTRFLSNNGIFPTSFSKVGNIYKKERGMEVC